MTFRAQYAAQLERATMLRDFMGVKGLFLVAVKTEGVPARVSVIGHAISPAAVDVWRGMGFRVHVLTRL